VSGWFVRNARDAEWGTSELGRWCTFEDDGRFEQAAINLNLMRPGEPMTMYHHETREEAFLVLEGECLLIVEGEERPLKRWDFFYCPPGVAHAIVGAGDGPSLVLAAGERISAPGVVYPADPVAQKHGAAVAVETTVPKEAYAAYTFDKTPYQEGWLPE
jgi:uncharacterized cupin superfamily protein